MTHPLFTPLAELGDYADLPDAEKIARARAFFNLMRRRHTVREFAPDPVPREVLEACIEAAGRAPSGANHQPWHFALIGDPDVKRRLREAAEEEERAFYSGKAPQDWIDALEPLGTNAMKPYLEIAPWIIAVFAQRRGGPEAGQDLKNYYINESVGIAVGFLLCALQEAGLATLTHTPNPMTFLNTMFNRPASEKPYMLLVVGKPAPGALIPHHALKKKALAEIMSVF